MSSTPSRAVNVSRPTQVSSAPGKHKHQHYYDYKMAKEANRGKGTHAPLLVGLAFILLAGVCLIFYYYGL